MGIARVRAIALALLATTLLPMPALPAQEGTAAQVTDPAGDAFEYRSRDLLRRGAAWSCLAACDQLQGAAGAAPDQGAVPAPPSLDGLAVRFRDAPEHLVVELELAALDADLVGAVDPDAGKGTAWTVCWGPPEAPCGERVQVRAAAWNGVPYHVASYERVFDRVPDDACQDFDFCYWAVPLEIVPGAPGALRWTVPRDLLMDGAQGAVLPTPSFAIDRIGDVLAVQGMPSGSSFGWRADPGGVPASGGAVDTGTRHASDVSAPGEDYVLTTAPRPATLPTGVRFVEDAAGDAGDDSEQFDILRAGIVETPATLTLAVQLAFVYGEPEDYNLLVFFASPLGRNYYLEATLRATTFSYRGVRSEEAPGQWSLPVAVEAERVQGRPGWVNFTLRRDQAAEGDFAQGGLLRSFIASTFTFPRTPAPPGLPVDAGLGRFADRSEYLGPLRLAHATGEAAPLEATGMALPLEANALGIGLVGLLAVATAGAGAARRRRARAALAFEGPGVLAPGALFAGRYRVVRALGRGAVGEVFLARDETMAREVVLKRLAGDLRRNAVALERFRREAQLAGALQHPNIVTVHDTIVAGDEAVLVMEHVRGGTLADRLRAGPLPEEAAVPIALDALAALEDLHARGIVHRDIKPSNLLLDERGRAKLSDFGVARELVSGETVGVGRRTPVGTYAYMAPELARGLRASPQSDLYGVAATLYEALAGRPPVPVEGLAEFEARAKLLKEPPRLPLPGASKAVNRALARALAKDPELRFEDAAAMARALRGK